MSWYLVLMLYSTTDVFLGEHKTYSECLKSVSVFKEKHKSDKDIKSVSCQRGIIITDFVGEFEE